MELWKKSRAGIRHSPGPLVSTVSRVQKALPFQSLHEIILCLRRKEEGNGKLCFPQLSHVPVLQHGHLVSPRRAPAAVDPGLVLQGADGSDLSPLETRDQDIPEGASGHISQQPPRTGSRKPRGGILSEQPRNLPSRRRNRLLRTSLQETEGERCRKWRSGLQGGGTPGSWVTIIKDCPMGVPSPAEWEVKLYNLLGSSRPLREDEGNK